MPNDSDSAPVDQDARQRASDKPHVEYKAHDQKHTLNAPGTAHSRALARRRDNSAPDTHDERLKRLENSNATAGGRTLVKTGDVLNVRHLDEFPIRRVLGIVDGIPTYLKLRCIPDGLP